VKINIDGWDELRDQVGDEQALAILREVVAKIPEWVEREMRMGGRVVAEYDLDTGRETVQIRPIHE